MERTRVAVRCVDCSFETEYGGLPAARAALDDHESTTGHEVTWEIESLAEGVSRAGADAGVCGLPERANEDSPLANPEPADR